jgi:membrane-associated phospholipid phosphatase
VLETESKQARQGSGRLHWAAPSRRARIEVIVVIASLAAYFGVRALTEGAYDTALRNAHRVVDFQDAVGLGWDMDLHRAILDYHWVVTVFNWIYTWGHWPVIIPCGAFLFLRHPWLYYRTRNAFLISGAIGLVIFAAFPVAPPRLTDLDVVDTVTEYSNSYRLLQPPSVTNQYAAMPSLHFGWNLLIGIALVRVLRPLPLRVLAGFFPLLMGTSVVLTANHFILDAIVGGSLALFGLLMALILERRLQHTPVYRYLIPARIAPVERDAMHTALPDETGARR